MTTDHGLDTLIGDLQSSRFERRAKALNALGAMVSARTAPAALAPRLTPLAGHADPGIRAAALSLLGALDGLEVLPLLEAHAGDPEPEVRAVVEDAAEELGEAGRPLLKKLVKDSDFGVRFWAAAALSTQHEPEGFPVLVEGLAPSATRFEALQGLRRLGDRRAEEPVRKVLGKWFLAAIDRVAAAGVLASFGDEPSKALLLKELQRRGDVRGLAMEIAGELGLAEAVPVLEAVFKDKSDDYRGSAAMGLASMKQERFFVDFVALLRDESATADVRGDAAWALRLLDTSASRQALQEAEGSVRVAEVADAIREALAESAH
ncbi:MAG: HEAT repeat domain-containing protein [Deltaproteobacteria bacterium]|nr:HEAT repeat domain-containing protein [Deltaproteobacteria bacterium]